MVEKKASIKPAFKSCVLVKRSRGMSAPVFLDEAATYTILLVDMYFLSHAAAKKFNFDTANFLS
jgi:hypothetical protein